MGRNVVDYYDGAQLSHRLENKIGRIKAMEDRVSAITDLKHVIFKFSLRLEPLVILYTHQNVFNWIYSVHTVLMVETFCELEAKETALTELKVTMELTEMGLMEMALMKQVRREKRGN